MKVVPYILALGAIGLVVFVIVADRNHQLFDQPTNQTELAVLTANTIELETKPGPEYWLPISALTKDYDNNWAIYSLEPEKDQPNKVIRRHRVDLKKVEKEKALILPLNQQQLQTVLADGLHLVVPGQIVRSNPIVFE